MIQAYADLHDLQEDERVTLIGKTVMAQPVTSNEKPKIIGICVDDDGKKADRYIKKLKEKFPEIRVIDQTKGPTPGVITIRISGPLP